MEVKLQEVYVKLYKAMEVPKMAIVTILKIIQTVEVTMT